MDKKIKSLIKTLKKCAGEIMEELGPGWKEDIYQKALEVSLRHRNIMYETQRILPITFSDHVIGESIPDLVIWIPVGKKRVAFVVDLKADTNLKEEHEVQVQRYIKELRKQVHGKDQVVYKKGLVINFIKEATGKKIEDGFEEFDGVQVLEVKA